VIIKVINKLIRGGPLQKETRGHVPQFRKYGLPKGIQERFNHQHSLLQMTVERTFVLLKAKWKILASSMPQMRLEQQLEIIVTCYTLYNFIRLHKKGIPISATNSNVSDQPNVQLYNDSNQVVIDQFRDEIAKILSPPLA